MVFAQNMNVHMLPKYCSGTLCYIEEEKRSGKGILGIMISVGHSGTKALIHQVLPQNAQQGHIEIDVADSTGFYVEQIHDVDIM